MAILEFELRKAKETITALRENLTQQVELENASTRSETESNGSRNNVAVPHPQSAPEPIRAYEQKAINFLVHEYLLTSGYRLTSITFTEENAEQVNKRKSPHFFHLIKNNVKISIVRTLSTGMTWA